MVYRPHINYKNTFLWQGMSTHGSLLDSSCPQPPIRIECSTVISSFTSSVSRPITNKQRKCFSVARHRHGPSGVGTEPFIPNMERNPRKSTSPNDNSDCFQVGWLVCMWMSAEVWMWRAKWKLSLLCNFCVKKNIIDPSSYIFLVCHTFLFFLILFFLIFLQSIHCWWLSGVFSPANIRLTHVDDASRSRWFTCFWFSFIWPGRECRLALPPVR